MITVDEGLTTVHVVQIRYSRFLYANYVQLNQLKISLLRLFWALRALQAQGIALAEATGLAHRWQEGPRSRAWNGWWRILLQFIACLQSFTCIPGPGELYPQGVVSTYTQIHTEHEQNTMRLPPDPAQAKGRARAGLRGLGLGRAGPAATRYFVYVLRVCIYFETASRG